MREAGGERRGLLPREPVVKQINRLRSVRRLLLTGSRVAGCVTTRTEERTPWRPLQPLLQHAAAAAGAEGAATRAADRSELLNWNASPTPHLPVDPARMLLLYCVPPT